MDPAVAAECPPIIHPSDVASVGQPLPTSPAATPATVRQSGSQATPH
jgi:hypothetical protein